MSKNKVEKEDATRIRMNLWMPKKLFAYIENLASVEERTLTEVVREAIREKMEKDINSGVINGSVD